MCGRTVRWLRCSAEKALLLEPCGLACYLFGWFTIVFTNYVIQTEVVWPWWGVSNWRTWAVGGSYQLLIFFICASYIQAAISDPGSVQKNTATKADLEPSAADPDAFWKPKRRFCSKCSAIKPPRAHHCSTCNRCIVKMDHHCPWVNNCVGSNNMRFFLQFLFYIFVGGIYSVTLCVGRLLRCWYASPWDQCQPMGLASIVLIVLGAVFALFFGVFVVFMGCDQYEGMVTNTTAVESMKNWDEQDRSLFVGLTEAMGEPFGLHWFLPVQMPETSASFYKWKPADDKDAFDARDPLVKEHLLTVQTRLAQANKIAEERKQPGKAQDIFRELMAQPVRPAADGLRHRHVTGG